MIPELERHFHADMVLGAARLNREIGYNPTRFTRMLAEFGGATTARKLLSGRDASDGFTTLWEHGRLELSVEAFALLPWYQTLFAEHELATAAWRLVEHGFDVEAFLHKARHDPPVWTTLVPVSEDRRHSAT